MSIISPWFFYALQVADSIRFLAYVIGILAIFGFIRFYAIAETDGRKHIEVEARRRVKKCIWVVVIAILSVTFIPSKETLLSMMVAQNITYERVDMAGEKLETLVDKIVTKVMEATGK